MRLVLAARTLLFCTSRTRCLQALQEVAFKEATKLELVPPLPVVGPDAWWRDAQTIRTHIELEID